MARQRMIVPELWGDEGFLELSDRARLFFIGLISQSDDDGRGAASSKSLKAKIFPAEAMTTEEIDGYKAEVARHTHTVFYRSGDVDYYALLKWKEYQSINHPKPSTIPGPPADLVAGSFRKSGIDTGPLPDESGIDPVKIPETGTKPETKAAVLRMAEGFFSEERTA